jgi:hypothetical protein
MRGRMSSYGISNGDTVCPSVLEEFSGTKTLRKKRNRPSQKEAATVLLENTRNRIIRPVGKIPSMMLLKIAKLLDGTPLFRDGF